jgi:hypothetical protein
MTKQEEMRRRVAVAERNRREAKNDNLRSAFYSALFGVQSSRDDGVSTAFEQAQ